MPIYQNTGPSAGILAEFLGCDLVMPYGNNDYRNRVHYRSQERGFKLPIPINFGCARKYLSSSSFINYNSELISDKLYCFDIFHALDIKYPKLIDPKEYNKPFLGRRNKSSQGRGIIKFEDNFEKWDRYGSDFFVEFIDGNSEHRVHVWGDNILIELNKDFSENIHSFIRNYHNGSRLIPGYIPHKDRIKILNACIDVIKYAGLTFGAVDIIIDKNDNWYILEINSSPRLSKFYALIYAHHIIKIFNLNIDLEYILDYENVSVKKIPENYYFGL